MNQYIKTFQKPSRYIAGFFVMLFGLAFLMTSTAFAAVPKDANFNYVYKPTKGKCASGDFKVVEGRNNPTPYACIRLRSDKQGYSISALPAPAPFNPSNACPSTSGNGSNSFVYTSLSNGFGYVCIKATDCKTWDTSDYAPDSSCNNTAGVNGSTGTGCSSLGGNSSCDSCTSVSKDFTCNDASTNPVAFGQCQNAGDPSKGCGIIEKYINPLIKLLAGVVGLIVVIMIIVGGIEYSTAGGDPSKVTSAKKRIFNAIFALVAFMLLYAVLHWAVPGNLI